MRIEEALSVLKEQGYKYTGKREDMIRIFAREERYISAKELLEYMKADYPNLSFDTIYRNLSLFEELKILEYTELSGERIYRLSCDTDSHHHHLICTMCGKTLEIHACPMESISAKPTDFTITGHKFEIYGNCKECEQIHE